MPHTTYPMQDKIITQVYFDIAGAVEVHGIIKGEPVEWSTNAADREWDRMLDKVYFTIHEATYLNHEGLYVGRFDNYQNLHLLVEVNGQVLERVVRLKKYFEEKLLNEYHKNQ